MIVLLRLQQFPVSTMLVSADIKQLYHPYRWQEPSCIILWMCASFIEEKLQWHSKISDPTPKHLKTFPQIKLKHRPVDGRYPANQLRLVVYPYYLQGFSTIQTVVGLGMSEPSTDISKFFSSQASPSKITVSPPPKKRDSAIVTRLDSLGLWFTLHETNSLKA